MLVVLLASAALDDEVASVHDERPAGASGIPAHEKSAGRAEAENRASSLMRVLTCSAAAGERVFALGDPLQGGTGHRP